MATTTQDSPLTSHPNTFAQEPQIQNQTQTQTPAYNPSSPETQNNNGVITSQPSTSENPEPAYKKHLRESREQTGTQEWLNDKWSCFEPVPQGDQLLCLKATFCPCFVYGRTQARIADPNLNGYERINTDCIMWYGGNCFALGWVFNFLTRTTLRKTYDLKGDTLTDCLFSCCCHCCALIQQEKEVIGRQRIAAGNGTGYVPQPEMSAVPAAGGVVQ